MESLSSAKRSIIGTIATSHKVKVICLQETHVDSNVSNRYIINGYNLISYSLLPRHGRALYVRNDWADVSKHSSSKVCDVVRVGNIHIASVYKSPNEHWLSSNSLPNLPHPAVYVCDFNSHHVD